MEVAALIEIPGYTLLRRLGRGGMGEVYLAVQQSLGREVALKLLTPELSKDPVACERFVREARIAAHLHHPHIVPIHDVGVHQGTAYLAMEYEPGGTVAGLPHEQLDPMGALRIVRDIAAALDYAHRQGVIHRDVKPENVLRRPDGLCLLSDFGISRAVEAPTILTHEGASVGTPQYMSPEQLRGQNIDGRSDLYSLGVVLYQLLTGELPYSGTDGYVLGMQHINAPIPRLPADLGHVQPLLDSLMAKDPSARPQSGAEVVTRIDALLAGATPALTRPLETLKTSFPIPRPKARWLIGAAAALLVLGLVAVWRPWRTHLSAGAPATASIAVLPFVNMSADPNQEFFSDGIAEELLNRLAQYSDLKVAARTSAFQFKGKNLDVADIGRKLKVTRVLEGSVRKEGARLRITAQLIDSESGFHLWSETYERDASEVFKVQDEIATAIATALEGKLGRRPVAALSVRPIDPAAYDDYLQGRALVARRVGDNIRLGVEAYDRAIARAPSYSPAHSGRALALALSYWKPWFPLEQAYAQADAAADAALKLDPDNAEAHLVHGIVAGTALRIAQARSHFERAFALAPGNVDVLNFYGDFLMSIGDLPGTERMKRQAMALDPLAFVHALDLWFALYVQGRYADTLSLAQRSIELGAGMDGWNALFWTQVRLGRLDQAESSVQAMCQAREPAAAVYCPAETAALLAATGHPQEAQAALAKIAEPEVDTSQKEVQSHLAAIYANELHDMPKATVALRRSVQGINPYLMRPLQNGPHGARLPEEVSRDPDWLAVWADPRLHELMEAYRANLLASRKGG